MLAAQNTFLMSRLTIRQKNASSTYRMDLMQVVWVSISFCLPQTLCVHIGQHLKISVRNCQSLVYRVLNSMFSCQVSNSVSQITNMSPEPKQKQYICFDRSVVNVSKKYPLKVDDDIQTCLLMFKPIKNQTTQERNVFLIGR